MLLDKSIRRGAPVLNPEGDTMWVAFQYERLLGLCFRCGLLGHEAKREQLRKEAPSPPRPQPTDHQPPQTTDSPVVAPTGFVTSMEKDNNEGVMDSIMAFTAQNSHSMAKQTIMENINLDFMEEITPRVMREINSDNKELPNGKELNRKEKNLGVLAKEFINVPVMYVGNMGNLAINSRSETLALHDSEGK
nr:hypothetical protein CFP56_74929 [Quercus suber]